MSTYKLTYFNAKGAAEVCRFIFAQAEVKYEDVRLEWGGEEWAKLKPSTPTGKLPILEVDGKQLPGSGPIARFLAEKYGLAGRDDFENGVIAGVIDTANDFRVKMMAVIFESNEERKAKLLKVLEDEDIPTFFGIFERMIMENKDASNAGWIIGPSVTYADFTIYWILEYLLKICPSCLDKFPNVLKLNTSVEILPNIAKWLKERPKTEY